jgi:tetratricopeptide (TPR) repeat protein
MGSFVTNPYPGLRPFETEEDYLFFGREGQSEEILARLRRERFVAVVGTSGSGKSSLIRAGLLSYLYGGFMSGAGSHWRVAVMRPGGDPIRNLARALYVPSVLASGGISGEDAQQEQTVLEVTLRRSGLGLVEAIRQARLPATDNILVVVDQFEELFRFAEPSKSSRNEDDAAAFVKLLLESATQTTLPIYIVITMRSDFIGDCARYRDLPERVAAGLYLIPRMTRDQRREAIERPAMVAEAAIAPRLMNRLLNDGGDNPDLLPILQHALMRTWEYWRLHHEPGAPIDLDDYKASGEMTEALSCHAEEAWAELPDDRSRMIAKRMFQALTEKGEDNREVRRPTSVGNIAAVAGATIDDVVAVIDTFRRPGRSFLTPPANVPLTENTVIDISHESLIRGWTRLNKWVDEETESARAYQRLAETAVLEAQGRAGLFHGPDLKNAVAWREKEKPNPAWGRFYHPGFDTAMKFLDRSAAARQRQILVYGTLGLCLILWCGYLFYAHQRNIRREAASQAMILRQQQMAAAEEEKAKDEHAIEETRIAEAQGETDWVRNVSRTMDVSRIELASAASNLSSLMNDASPQEEKIQMQGIMAQAQTEMGEHEKAAQAYTQLLVLHPDQRWSQEERSYEYILLGRADDAIADLKAYLEDDPNSFLPHMNLAVALGMEKRYREADAEIQKGIRNFQFGSSSLYDSEISPDIQRATGQTMLVETPVTFYVTMFYELASLKAFAGDPEFATALDQADATARKQGYNLGGGAVNDKATLASVDPFLLGIEWAWLSARAQNISAIGPTREDYGVYAAYGALWERAARIQPRFKDWAGHFYAVFLQEHAKQKQSRYDGMAAWVDQQMHALYPATGSPPPIPAENATDITALTDEADVANERGKYSDAAKILTTAIQEVEHWPNGRSELIMLLMRRADTYVNVQDVAQQDSDTAKNAAAAAQNDCRRVLKMDPHTAKAYFDLAETEKDAAAEERDYELAFQYDPRLRFAGARVGILLEKSNPKRALALLEQANRVDTPDMTIFQEIAKIQNAAGNYGEALAAISRAIAMQPDNGNSYLIKAEAEKGLHWSAVEIAIERASDYRKLGDYLARTGQQANALRCYVQSLHTLAEDPAGKGNDSVLAEETVTAHELSQTLDSLGSHNDAKRFWTAVSTTPYLAALKDIAQKEIQRLTP